MHIVHQDDAETIWGTSLIRIEDLTPARAIHTGSSGLLVHVLVRKLEELPEPIKVFEDYQNVVVVRFHIGVRRVRSEICISNF